MYLHKSFMRFTTHTERMSVHMFCLGNSTRKLYIVVHNTHTFPYGYRDARGIREAHGLLIKFWIIGFAWRRLQQPNFPFAKSLFAREDLRGVYVCCLPQSTALFFPFPLKENRIIHNPTQPAEQWNIRVVSSLRVWHHPQLNVARNILFGAHRIGVQESHRDHTKDRTV